MPLPKYTQTFVPASVGGFAFRLIYFLLAPALLVAIAQVLPITGAIVNVALALIVFAAAEGARGYASSSKLAAKLLAKPLAFEAYYRLNPPRNFAYYVFYPLLFPYWLANRKARGEFLLFKGYTLFSLVLLIAGAMLQFFTQWQPDLSFGSFVPMLFGTLVLEAFIVLALMMPIATTVVHFHMTFRRKRLIALLVVGLLSSGLAVARFQLKRSSMVSFATKTRIMLRTKAAPAHARAAQRKALRLAWAYVGTSAADVDDDGLVGGDTLEAVQVALQSYYRADEARAFLVWASPRKQPKRLVLFFAGDARTHELVSLTVDRDGKVPEELLTEEEIEGLFKRAKR